MLEQGEGEDRLDAGGGRAYEPDSEGLGAANVFSSCIMIDKIPLDISLGHRISCQHEAFSGVGAFLASFVPAECPKGGGGMWGILEKPLKAFRRCIG